MNIPLVSIIIPSYNSLKYLDDSISSALNQTYKNIEVILIDDGSTDGTKDSFEKFEKLGVKCIYQENAGASTARNTGLDNAKGEYIQFLDADDILHKEKIKKQIDKMQIEDADLSFTPWSNFKEKINNSEGFKFNNIDYGSTKSGIELMISYGEENWFIPTSAWLVSKKLINKAGYWNPNITINDDGEYFTRILLFTGKVICVDEVLTFYREVPTSLSKFDSETKLMSSFLSWKLIYSYIILANNTKLLVYPKNGMYSIYRTNYKKYSKYSKIISNFLDDYDNNIVIIKDKWLLRCVNILGYSKGHLLFKVLQTLRYRSIKYLYE